MPKSKTKTSLTKIMLGNEHLQLPPVIVKSAFISTASPYNNKCGKLGGIFDDCSTDHYVTHDIAKKYNFPGQEVELEVEGIAGINHVVSTIIYTVTVFDLKGRKHDYQCYGLDMIASADVPDPHYYRRICSKFGVKHFSQSCCTSS